MLCAAPRDKPLLQGELWAIFFSLVLGITNGYFGSVPMILAPSKVPDEDKELTGIGSKCQGLLTACSKFIIIL